MTKDIIGMVHLRALPGAPENQDDLETIYEAALADLLALEEGGIQTAIVENMFDTPYTHSPSLDTVVMMAHLFTRLKAKTKLCLGVNIQATDGIEEMILATYCGADFIRAESFVENRVTGSGVLRPMAPALMRKKKELNSKVKVYADINVKHSVALTERPIEDLIHEAIDGGCDAIILTGVATGSSPSPKDAKHFKKVCGETPLYIGSGVSQKNIKALFAHADGAIIGSSIKEDGDVKKPVDKQRVKELLDVL